MSRNGKNIVIIATIVVIIILALIIYLYISPTLQGEKPKDVTSEPINPVTEVTAIETNYKTEDLDESYIESELEKITLQNTSITTSSQGATASGSTVTITKGGSYYITGSLDNGRIIIDASKEETIRLVFDNVNVNCNNNAPFYVKTADKVIVTLAPNSVNTFTDGSTYQFEDGEDEPDGAFFSKEDLTINGSGTLNVTSNYMDGIVSKDDLLIVNGIINVTANDDGIRGKDSVSIKNGTITVNAKSDGIKSTNDTETDKGYVLIECGNIQITAEQDGIQAETNLSIKAGNITIKSGGGSESATTKTDDQFRFPNGQATTTTEDSVSMKGIKATVQISISGGSLNINSQDDTVHSNESIIIEGGDLTLQSGDDGIHADTNVLINNGNINITKSYEGIESANIVINGGNIKLIASDDGINASDGSSSETMGGFGMMKQVDTNLNMTFNGGYVVVDASGDGLDSNGHIYVNGGTVIINGPTNSGNGAIDYEGECIVKGGTLIAAGSSGMAQSPSNSSEQYCVAINLQNTQTAGSIINIKNSAGEEILTFAPSKNYQSVIISSPELEKGETYTISTGGTYSNTATDGLYTNGTYSEGTQYTTFTISDILTQVGSGFNQNGGMPKENGGFGGGKHK